MASAETVSLGTVYTCHNKACSLGSLKDPGHFTSGMTPERKNLLTGDPVEGMVEGKDYGEGVCPNCGEKGTATKQQHESLVGSDPNQNHHDIVQAEVLAETDEEKRAVLAQNAQARFEERVGP